MARFILIVVLVIIASLSYSSGTGMRPSKHLDEQSQEKTLRCDNCTKNSLLLNCSNYAAEINEGDPPGTVVIKLHASDLLKGAGAVMYSLMTMYTDRREFTFNSKTRLIRTTKSFDRDAPFYEEVKYVLLIAKTTQLHSYESCVIKVTIKDVNDNPPVFDTDPGNKWIPKDYPVNEDVMRISATDIDDGNNSVVVYSLSPKKEDDGPYFRIDTRTGVIYLAKKLDKNHNYRFSMTARAQDLGDDPKYSDVSFDICVYEYHK